MVELNVETIVGILVFLVVVLYMAIPAAEQIITHGNPAGTVNNEVWNATAFVARSLTFTPLLSISSLFKANLSSVSNTVAQTGFNFPKSLSTNTVASGVGPASLDIVCEYSSPETVNVTFGGHVLGVIDSCPKTFTNVSQSWIGDPATTVVFANYGTEAMDVPSNSTVLAQSNELRTLFLPHYDNLTGTVNVTVTSEFNSSDTVYVKLGDTFLGFLASASDTWTGLPSTELGTTTNITFEANFTSFKQTVVNSTVLTDVSAGGFNDVEVLPIYDDSNPISGSNVTISCELGTDEEIEVWVNGHKMTNNITSCPSTYQPDTSFVFDGWNRVAYQSNGTASNITGLSLEYMRNWTPTNITQVSLSYQYHEALSNFTNMTLNYSRWTAYAGYNSTASPATITATNTGTYKISYTYGAPSSGLVGTILSIIPAFLGVLALFVLAKVFGMLG